MRRAALQSMAVCLSVCCLLIACLTLSLYSPLAAYGEEPLDLQDLIQEALAEES